MTTDSPEIELTQSAIALLRESLEAATQWHQIASPLRHAATAADDANFVLASAFDYMLVTERRKGPPDAFEPMIRFESGETVPPLLETVKESWLDLWERSAELDLPAAGRARLHDLLAERRYGRVPDHARAAISAYLQLSEAERWSDLDRADARVRALRLARRFSFEEEALKVVASMIGAISRSLGERDPKPGVPLRMLRTLVADPDAPAEVDDLLEDARALFDAAHLTDSIIDLQRSRCHGDPSALKSLEADRARAWLREANRREGLVRVVHLETAARVAHAAGLRDIEAEAQQLLQAVSPDDVQLAHFSEEIKLPDDVVAGYLEPFTSATNARDLLVALISHPPATGDVEANRVALEQSRAEFPLQHLFPRMIVGGDGLPRWQPSTDEQKQDGDLAQQELLRLQVLGGLMARGLWEGGESASPATEEVVEFLGGLPNAGERDAQLLARAFAFYWSEDWTSSLLSALPLVEGALRRLVLALGRGIYQTQRGQRPGQYPGLGALLGWLKAEGLDESWYRYIWTVLASPAGLNLRNEVAHGFVTSVGPTHAAVVLHIVLWLFALEVEISEEVEDGD